jgi:Fur family ferric uptake transcriptional regulator
MRPASNSNQQTTAYWAYDQGVARATAESSVHEEAPASAEGVLRLIRGQGGRVTTSRRLLVQALFESAGHASAEELAEVVQAQAPDVHLSTIYRNLEELERLGIVTHAHLGHGPATYHLTARTHGHLVCEVCQATIEVPDEMFSSLSRTARARFGFAIDPYHFAVLGRCRACAL